MVTYIHTCTVEPLDLWRQKKVPTLATYRYFRCVLIDRSHKSSTLSFSELYSP